MTSPNHPPGFIFMCNSVTKPTCFLYRVFGFPINKKDVVEKVKPGTKLFLFDVELKLLYGIYEATSSGQVDLEPDVFGGKFPAQVKFRIFGDYLPVPEKTFRMAIIENYQGKKFSPELNEVQVKKLQLLFRPLSSSSSPPARLPRRIADRPTPYARRVIRRQPLHGIQMVQQHHLPHAVAHNGSLMAPIEQYYHVNSQPPPEVPLVRYRQLGASAPFGQSYYTQQYSSGGPIRNGLRHDAAVQDTTAYYQTIRAESEYRISLQRNAFQQHQTHLPSFEGQSVALPYNYHPTLQPRGPETVPNRETVAAYYQVPPSMPSSSTIAAPSHSVYTDPYAIAAPSHSVNTDPYAIAAHSQSVYTDPYAVAAPSHSINTDPYAVAAPSHSVYTDPHAVAAPSHSVYTDPHAVAAPSHSVSTDPYAVTAYYNTVPAAEPYVPSAVVGSYPTALDPYVMSAVDNMQHSGGTGTAATYVLSTSVQPQVAMYAMPEQSVLAGSSYSQQI